MDHFRRPEIFYGVALTDVGLGLFRHCVGNTERIDFGENEIFVAVDLAEVFGGLDLVLYIRVFADFAEVIWFGFYLLVFAQKGSERGKW